MDFGAILGILKGAGNAALTAAPAAARVYTGHMQGRMAGDELARKREEEDRLRQRQERQDLLDEEKEELNREYLTSQMEKLRAETAATTTRRTQNQGYYDRLRTDHPDRYGAIDFDPNYDYSRDLRALTEAAEVERELIASGLSKQDAHLRAHHQVNMPAERRAEASNARAAAGGTSASETRGELGDRRTLARTRIGNMLASGAPVEQVTQAMGSYKDLAGAWTPDDVVELSRSSSAQPREPQAAQERRDAVRQTLGKRAVHPIEVEVENDLVAGRSYYEIVAEIARDPNLSAQEKQEAKAIVDRFIPHSARARFGR